MTRAALKALEDLFYYLSMAAMLGLSVVMLASVVFRYVPGTSSVQPWIPGVLSLLDSWLIFVGSVVAMRRNTHLRVTFLIDRLAPATRAWVEIGVNVVTFVLLVGVTYFSIPIVETGMSLTFGGVPFSKGYQFIALPLSTTAMALMVIERIATIAARLKFVSPR